jgi:hypothetical protein
LEKRKHEAPKIMSLADTAAKSAGTAFVGHEQSSGEFYVAPGEHDLQRFQVCGELVPETLRLQWSAAVP